MRTTISSFFLVLLASILALPGSAGAQSREGTVRITIQDQTGAILPFARVTLANEAGDTRTATPNERGLAAVTGIPYGEWLLIVQAEGFQLLEQLFTVDQATTDTTVQLRLEVIHEEIFVDEPPATDRSGNAFSRTLSPDEIDALSDDSDEMEEALRQMAGPGARVYVDGFSGGRLPPKNQIQQIRFRTNSFSAENHDAGMVRIDVITRAGMTGWGGMANFGFRDDALNARNAFAPERGPEQQNRFSVNLGGPLAAGRTSFGFLVDGHVSYDSQTILAALPGETLASQVRRPIDEAGVRFSLDHALGQNNQLKATVEHRTSKQRNLGVGNFDLPDRAFTLAMTTDQIRVTNHRVVGTKAFNELRLSFTTQTAEHRPLTDAPTVRVLDAFTTGGAGQSGARKAREIEIANNVDFTVGRHTMRAGVLIEGGWWDSTSASNTNGTFTFATIEDYMIGRPSLYTQRVGESAVSYGHLQAGWYLQDDFHIGRNLSLGLGLRQEVQMHLSDRWNLAPRAAFTWTPGGGGTTLRGGWGVFHDWFETSLYEETLRLDGTRQEEIVIIDPGYPDPDAGLSRALPASLTRAAADLRMPVIQQMSFGMERPLTSRLSLRSDYLRLRGKETFRSVNVNAPVDGVRPDPSLGNITEIVSTGRAHTDRLTVGLSLRMPEQRVFGNLMYQFGRSQNYADSALSLPSDSTNPETDWGLSAQDVRHRVFLMANVPLFGRTRFSFQVQGASGLPYTMTTGMDDNGDTVFNDRPHAVRRNSLRGSATWNVNMRLQHSFNLGGTPSEGPGPIGIGGGPARGRGGSMERGGEGGPTIIVAEGGGSRYRLDFYVQAFNVFNHTNLSRFVGNILSPFFGSATSAGPARRLEVGVTLAF